MSRVLAASAAICKRIALVIFTWARIPDDPAVSLGYAPPGDASSKIASTLRRFLKKTRRLWKLKAALRRKRLEKEAAEQAAKALLPPTEAKTKAAQESLRVARDYIDSLDNVYKSKKNPPEIQNVEVLKILPVVTHHLQEAQRADPYAELHYTGKTLKDQLSVSVESLIGEALYEEGRVLILMSEYRDDYLYAKAVLEKALLYEKLPPYYTMLARAHFSLKEPEKAREYLRLALQRDKTYTAAQELLDGLATVSVASRRPRHHPSLYLFFFGLLSWLISFVVSQSNPYPQNVPKAVLSVGLFFLGVLLFGLAWSARYERVGKPLQQQRLLNNRKVVLPSNVFHGPTYDPNAQLTRVKALYERYPFKTEQACEKHAIDLGVRILKDQKKFPSDDICTKIGATIYDIFKMEGYYERKLPFTFDPSSPYYASRYTRETLTENEKFLSDALNNIATLEGYLTELIHNYLKSAPRAIYDEDTGQSPKVFSVELAQQPAAFVHQFISFSFDNQAAFPKLYERLRDNVLEASNIKIEQAADKKDKLMFPPLHPGTPVEIAYTYLKDTPFRDLVMTPVPFAVPERTRFEHTAIIAGSGWGKTQLLQSIIASDLKKDDPPSLIILDSTGAIIERVQKLAVFNDRLKDRIVILDPAGSPSLNMFDISTPRFQAYSEDERENVQTEIIALFNYIFTSTEYDLSSQMGVAFAYAVRLVLSRPGSTITDLRRLLDETPKTFEGSAFFDEIKGLDPDALDFFKHHFFAETLRGTRASIARRIHALVAIPAFRRMFTASKNTLDVFDEMNKGTIVLVNTNISLLKEDGMVLFGRYIIARALAAAFERSTIAQSKRKPTFLIVDEAAPYFDATFEKLLSRVRQFNLGVVIAFQNLDQADDKLKAAIASNTSIKYAGGLGSRDRRWLASDMETTPEFIAGQRKDNSEPPEWTQFALFVRNHTEKALSVFVPFYQLEEMPQMTEQEHSQLVARNKQRLLSLAPEAQKSSEGVVAPVSAETDNPPGHDSTNQAAPTPKPDASAHPPSNDPHTGDHTDAATKWGE
jgi:tetratricopeptide (TPR) repeat protein